MEIELQFLGAVGTVTGSQYLVRFGEKAILVDCGLFQGSPSDIERNRLPFEYDPTRIDALLLTHAHLDHCGRIPALVAAGYAGPLHATAATLDLTEIVLRDSAKLQEEAAARWLRRHPGAAPEPQDEAAAVDADAPSALRRQPPEASTQARAPLYTLADVERTVTLFRPAPYEQPIEIVPGCQATFHDAGHILGSAIIELRLTDADGRVTTVVFSGDLGRPNTPILRDPTPIAHADYVLVESTYGNREHAPEQQAIDQLASAITEVAGGSGVLLIPSFAIGRFQEIVFILDELLRGGRIPHLPLYLDAPMASRATDVYARHPEDYDAETVQLQRAGGSPLEYPGERYTNDPEQSKAIRQQPRPLMIVASSGMLTGGRIVHHLKDFLPDPASTLLFVGYQGEGTLGHAIQAGAKEARIDGQRYPVRCRVISISGFSAHADEHELVAWLRHFAAAGPAADGEPKQVFIVHGDPDAATALAERVRTEIGLTAYLPRYRESVRL